MSSPKDELIANLRGQVDTLSRLLELALSHTEPELNPGAARQRRYRERHKASQDVTLNRNERDASPHEIASRSASLSRHNGDAPPRESVNPSSSSGDVTNVPLNQDLVSNSLSEPASRNVTKVTAWDRDRAAEDAAKKGLDTVAFEAELQRFQDYWDSCGWKRKNGPVKDRNATWRSWLDSPFRNGKGKDQPAEPGGYAGLREYIRHRDAAKVIEGETA